MQRILNYYPNYPTHHLYFGEVKTPYIQSEYRWMENVGTAKMHGEIQIQGEGDPSK